VFWFLLKVFACLFVFLWVRATLPRYRYDQIMALGWKVFLPVSLGYLVLVACVLEFGGLLPHA
jgi:NADH-quinone oxidoreductase subunit H